MQIMKLDSGIIQNVCLNDEWAVPTFPLTQKDTANGDNDNTWERKIRIGLRPGLGGTIEKVDELANQMVVEIQHMAKEGNRQRKLRQGVRIGEEENGTGNGGHVKDQSTKRSVRDFFSATAPTMVPKVFGRRSLAENEVPSHHKFWSRTLDEGIESDDGCIDMFEALSIEARFSNTGFDLILNPLGGQNYANNGTSSASNSACVCSLIAALSVHPNTLDVSANRPIELHNLQAQHLVQSGKPLAQTPFFDVGLTGRGEIVSVSDTGLSMSHCYFKNNVAGNRGNVFNGVRHVVAGYFL